MVAKKSRHKQYFMKGNLNVLLHMHQMNGCVGTAYDTIAKNYTRMSNESYELATSKDEVRNILSRIAQCIFFSMSDMRLFIFINLSHLAYL